MNRGVLKQHFTEFKTTANMGEVNKQNQKNGLGERYT